MKSIQRVFSFLIIALASTTSAFSAETATDNNALANEGNRLGRAYYEAKQAGDINKQNSILKNVNSIIGTLKNQAQADAFSNAFNKCNLPITTPEKDAIIYSRAYMNAQAKGDATAIEDAADIAKNIRNIYLTDRGKEQADLYAKLYDCAAVGAKFGKEYSQATDNAQRKTIKNNATSECNKMCAGDTQAVNAFNHSFDFHSITLTTPDKDAATYSTLMKSARASRDITKVNAAARTIHHVYEHYTFERSKEEAQKFGTKIQKLIGKKK